MFDDFKDLLSAFKAAGVGYLIVSRSAVSLRAQRRATKDLDILISTDSENSRAVYIALAKEVFPNGHASGDGRYHPQDKRLRVRKRAAEVRPLQSTPAFAMGGHCTKLRELRGRLCSSFSM
jgi:hypothetical protein